VLWDEEFGYSSTHTKKSYTICVLSLNTCIIFFMNVCLYHCSRIRLEENKFYWSKLICWHLTRTWQWDGKRIRCLYFGVFACGYYGQHNIWCLNADILVRKLMFTLWRGLLNATIICGNCYLSLWNCSHASNIEHNILAI